MHVRKRLLPIAILLAPATATTAVAGARPTVATNGRCYLVRQHVGITGTGFAPSRTYDVAVDGINFGMGKTESNGGFTASLLPGGLGANIVQEVHVLSATDGTNSTRTTFTVTRTTGARILTGAGAATTLRGRFQVWGFGLGGVQSPLYEVPSVGLRVYVHYVAPHQHVRATVALGRTGGQCGYLKTAARRVFPFVPAPGAWTLQVDTSSSYSRHPLGPVAKIAVRVA